MEAKGASGSGRPVRGILKNPSGGGGGGGGGLGLVVGASAASAASAAASSSSSSAAGARQRQRPEELLLGEASSRARHEEEEEEEEARHRLEGKKCQKWDEMNILATYHPPGKDYGLMKIDEPSTPYHRMAGDDEDGGSDTEISEVPTADVLAKKLAAAAEGKGPKVLSHLEESSEEEEEEEEADLSPEEREKKRQFEMKRKMHYNEAQNIKLARQLIAKELHGEAAEDEDEDEDDEEMKEEAGETSPALVPPPARPSSDSHENVACSLEEVCSGL